MSEKNWDSWKDHDTYIEVAIFREEAEKEQIETKPMSISDLGKPYKEIYVRGVFVAGCPKEYKVRLRLGELFRPMVAITTPEGVITFVANLEKKKEEV